GEQFQDPAPDRITENIKGVHGSNYFSFYLYKSILSYMVAGLDASRPRCRRSFGIRGRTPTAGGIRHASRAMAGDHAGGLTAWVLASRR
ncbi:hypothetical protein ACWCSH_04100, partial [Streptosporangium sp. NPDC001682]